MKTIFTFLFSMMGCLANAQEHHGGVHLTVANANALHLENATVELIRAKDSVLVKVSITDKNGATLFENIPPGWYLLRTTMINYATTYSLPIELSEGQAMVTAPPIILQPVAKQLGGVIVVARKPFIQKLSDRIVVNVENSIVSAGSSAMEVLERSPGVNVDQNDNIGLKGKQGVIVMIDGKPTPMTGADLANYLRGLPSEAIERIDIITNPSARYDAAGNSGIIDIRIKKDQRMGINGTFTAGYGQGIYPKASTGNTFNLP
ncbi:MAG: TonB-dependent receptor [Ferruginibacter sp.]